MCMYMHTQWFSAWGQAKGPWGRGFCDTSRSCSVSHENHVNHWLRTATDVLKFMQFSKDFPCVPSPASEDKYGKLQHASQVNMQMLSVLLPLDDDKDALRFYFHNIDKVYENHGILKVT